MKYASEFIIGAFSALLLVVAVTGFRQVAHKVAEQRVPWDRPLVERDLDLVLGDTLRVLVLMDPLSYEERPNAVSGLEYELMERFAKELGVPVKAIPVDHPDSMLMALQKGQGDVIAAQATPRRDRRRWVSYSAPYRSVYPVLAILRADPLAFRSTALCMARPQREAVAHPRRSLHHAGRSADVGGAGPPRCHGGHQCTRPP